jgi:hypothetical protein
MKATMDQGYDAGSGTPPPFGCMVNGAGGLGRQGDRPENLERGSRSRAEVEGNGLAPGPRKTIAIEGRLRDPGEMRRMQT